MPTYRSMNSGFAHGKATATDATVAEARRRWHNRPRGFRMKQLAREYPGHAYETVRDWVYNRTRKNASTVPSGTHQADISDGASRRCIN